MVNIFIQLIAMLPPCVKTQLQFPSAFLSSITEIAMTAIAFSHLHSAHTSTSSSTTIRQLNMLHLGSISQ